MEKRVLPLLEKCIQTEDPKELMDCLVSVIASEFAAEIDAAFLSRDALTINFRPCRSFSCSPNSSSAYQNNDTVISMVSAKQMKISVAADVVAASRRFKEFRLKILELCCVLIQNLWKTDIEQTADIISSEKVALQTREYYEDYYEENALPEDFSDANSMLVAPYKGRVVEADIDNMIALIISETINAPTRRKNLQMLSSSIDELLKSERELDIILNHLNQILCNPDLFLDTMHLIALLLNVNDEASTIKICSVISRVAPSVLRNQQFSSTVRVQFANFFIQVFYRASKMWRKFSCTNLKIVLMHFMELITSEFVGLLKTRKNFVSLASKLDPDVRWFRGWLHNFTFRKIIRCRLVDFIAEILECCAEILENKSMEQYSAELNFQISVVINCLKYSDILVHLNFYAIKNFVLQSLELAHGSEELGNLKTLLLDISTSISGATFLANQLVPEICTFCKQFTANLLVNILRYSDPNQPLNASSLKSIMQLVDRSSSAGNLASAFQLSRSSNHLGVIQAIVASTSGTPNSVYRQSSNVLSGIEGRRISTESSVKILAQILVRYSAQTLNRLVGDVRPTLAKLCESTECYFGNPDYCRLFLALGFFAIDAESLRAWRRAVNPHQLLTAMLMQPKMSTVSGRYGFSPVSHPLDRFSNDGRRLCTKILMKFLLSGSGGVTQHELSRFNVEPRRLSFSGQISMNTFFTNRINVSKRHLLSFDTFRKLDFLLSNVSASTNLFDDFLNNNAFDFLPLSNSIFMFITQPGVLIELLKTIDFTSLISEKLSAPASSGLIDFIKRLECFISNLEVLVELRRNAIIQTKFLQVLQKYCVDRSGQPIVDEFSVNVCRFLTKLSAINKPLINKTVNDRSYFCGHKNKWSDSFDSFKDDEMLDNALTLPSIHCHHSSFVSKNAHAKPTLESGRLNQLFRTPIEEEYLLFSQIHAYLDAENISPFKTLSKNVSSMRMTRKMCSAQADWLLPLLDYAVSIKKVPNRQIAHQRCVGLRFLPATPFGDSSSCITSTVDCFLGALFLASNLDAPATVSLCERLSVYMDYCSGNLKQKANLLVHPASSINNGLVELPKLKLPWKMEENEKNRSNFSEVLDNVADNENDSLEEFINECSAVNQTKCATFWPLAVSHLCESASTTYSDVISTQIYPIVLKIIAHRRMSVLYDFVEQLELPLLHLLLFYSNHCYLGVLEFEQVEEYLMFSVIGGAKYQAFHFCAVLQYISETRRDLVHLNVNKMYFLRPSMKNFSFRHYIIVFKQILLEFNE